MTNSNVLDYVRHQVNNDYDVQAFFVGTRGSGKSCAAVRFGELFDSSFDISRVCYTTKEVLAKVKELHKTIGTKGKVIIYDEAGVGIGNRDWQKESNKLMNYFVQQSRVFGMVIIYTAPNLSFVDRQARAMGGVMLRFNKKWGKGVAMPYKVEADDITGDLKTPRFYLGNTLLSYQKFRLPSKKLLADYENKSRDQKKESFDFEKRNLSRLTPQQKFIWDKHNQGFKQVEIAKELKVYSPQVSRALSMIRKKLEVF